ncbi:hypothetical protein JW968_03045 [Candidatus Woesearchaeota archaeon]|nr:hypothetical protein [Candidatus Woesearchaeota archaeon]
MKITIDTNESPEQIRKLIRFLQEIIGDRPVPVPSEAVLSEVQDAPSGAFNMFGDAPPAEKTEEKGTEQNEELKIIAY